MFKCCPKRKKVDAAVSGSALVVSLPGAENPRVWRTDLARAATSALEVRESGGRFALIMTASGSPDEEIAIFADKASATDALRAVTDAMLSGGASGLGRFLRKGLVIAFWIFLIWLALGILKAVLFPPGMMMGKAPASLVKPGVPVPADQMFGGK